MLTANTLFARCGKDFTRAFNIVKQEIPDAPDAPHKPLPNNQYDKNLQTVSDYRSRIKQVAEAKTSTLSAFFSYLENYVLADVKVKNRQYVFSKLKQQITLDESAEQVNNIISQLK